MCIFKIDPPKLSLSNSFYTELRPLVLKQFGHLVCPIKESVRAYFLQSEKKQQQKKKHSRVVDTKIIHRVGFSVWILVTCFELVRGLGKHNFLKLSIYFSVSCGSKVNNTLQSPAYSDGFYAGNMNCSYNVSIPDGKALRLKFQTFDLDGSDSGCR